MVLSRVVLCLALLAGCKQSLFDNNSGDGTVDSGGGGDDGGGDGSVASSCPATCLADAAADFGTSRWRYLEDRRTRMWSPLTEMEDEYVGSDPANRITRCAANGGAAACSALPGALLVSTAGAQSNADPALAYTATQNAVVQLTVRVHVPAGAAAHDLRLYRNSREDSLLTASLVAGATFERAITVDALTDDRFYLALAPREQAATESIGVHFYINATEDTLPHSCRLALSFSAAASDSVANACGAAFTYYDYNLTPAQAPMLTAGPFPEMGMAADIPMERYYQGADVLVRDADTTTQLWVRHDAFVETYSAVVFSDMDLNDADGGGIAIYIKNAASPIIGAETCTDGNAVTFLYGEAAYPDDQAWHFVRVVHASGMVKLCVDGTRIASFPLPAGKLQSTYPPYVGKNVVWSPASAYLDGAVDDVRVIGAALPCD